MSTIIKDSIVTIDSSNETVSNLTMNDCTIDNASNLDLSNSSYISLSHCVIKHMEVPQFSGASNVTITGCNFEKMNLPKEERVEFMEEWLQNFDEDMYAQWILWSGR